MTFFTLDIGKFIFSFLVISVARSQSINVIDLLEALAFVSLFFYDFLFFISLISTVIFLISFLLITLGFHLLFFVYFLKMETNMI